MKEIHISLKPEVLFEIGNFPVTNSLLISIVISAALIIFFVIVVKRLKAVPTTSQLFAEVAVMGALNFAQQITQDKKLGRAIFPVFLTAVLFILISNLMGNIPFLTPLSYDHEPIFRPPTTDYGFTLTLTLIMLCVWQATTIVTGGAFAIFKKYINFSSPMNFAVGLLELIGEIARTISLSFRLFGNIFAGEAIVAVMLGLTPFLIPVPFTLLGLVGAVVQAFILPILTLIFISMAVVKEGGHH